MPDDQAGHAYRYLPPDGADDGPGRYASVGVGRGRPAPPRLTSIAQPARVRSPGGNGSAQPSVELTHGTRSGRRVPTAVPSRMPSAMPSMVASMVTTTSIPASC